MSVRPPWNPAMGNGCSVPEVLQRLIPELARQCELCREFCNEHDRLYYEGGSHDDRKRADRWLLDQIIPVIGEQWANQWYIHLRLYGGSHWGSGRAWDGRAMWELPRTEG